MPNATATIDTDFGHRAPPRRKSARASSRKKGRKLPLAQRFAMLDSVPRYGAIAISVLIGVGIIVNALLMQHGTHPAPLFAGAASGHAAAAKPAVPKPAVATSEIAKPDAIITPAASPPATAAAPVGTGSRGSARLPKVNAGDDPIARLLGAAPAGATAHRGKSAVDRTGAKTPRGASEKRRSGED